MCSPGAMRKCSVTVLGRPAGTVICSGVKVLDGRGLGHGAGGIAVHLGLNRQTSQSQGQGHGNPRPNFLILRLADWLNSLPPAPCEYCLQSHPLRSLPVARPPPFRRGFTRRRWAVHPAAVGRPIESPSISHRVRICVCRTKRAISCFSFAQRAGIAVVEVVHRDAQKPQSPARRSGCAARSATGSRSCTGRTR